MAKTDQVDDKVAYWRTEIERAKRDYRTFWEDGDNVVDAYRLQKANGENSSFKDKYNILYSSTETIRPNLYAQTPKVRANLRNKDVATDTARLGARLWEGCITYLMSEEDFDELMESSVEDYLLPGLGTAWVRYDATFQDQKDDQGNKVQKPDGKKGEYQQELLDEMVKIEYVYWQDFLTGVSRTWKGIPWAAKRFWPTKEEATKRFGTEKANKLVYSTRDATGRDKNPSETAECWEVWDKVTMTVYWYSDDCPELLDEKPDPLKLKRFFPCPRPMRAIKNTRTMVPRALYSQYKSQAETLNVMTKRIRLLSEALRVVGLYDGSQVKLADLLNPAAGNRMIAVDNWAMFAQSGGVLGTVQWLPIDQVVKVLNELMQARETAKQEIYEITGFADITRGVSKASETLGAQNIKQNWAGGRVKLMQNEVQRFARDLLSLAGELVAEHCSEETIALFSAIPIPDPQDVQQNPALQQQVLAFKNACDFLKNEARRVAMISIETDSTLLADESAEREDRTKMLAAAGAFLQQAVPAMEATPELGPLLGAMLMFTVRTFPSSRDIEDAFEKVQQYISSNAQQPQNQDKDGKKAAAAQQAQAAAQQAQIKMQELQVRQQHETADAQQAAATEANRHQEKMIELSLKEREVSIQEAEIQFKATQLQIDMENAKTARFTAQANAAFQGMANEAEMQAAQSEERLQYAQLDQDDQHHADELNQAAQQHAAEQETARQAAVASAADGGPDGAAGSQSDA